MSDNVERWDAPNKQAVGLPPPWEVQATREDTTVTQTTPTGPAQPQPAPQPEPVPDNDDDDTNS